MKRNKKKDGCRERIIKMGEKEESGCRAWGINIKMCARNEEEREGKRTKEELKERKTQVGQRAKQKRRYSERLREGEAEARPRGEAEETRPSSRGLRSRRRLGRRWRRLRAA